MIVLFSFEADKNTNYLIEWLKYYNCPFKRADLQNEDFRNIGLSISNGSSNIKLKLVSGDIIDFSKCSYFYVRGKGFIQPEIENTTALPDKVFGQYMEQEFNSLAKYFYSEVNKKSVGCFCTDSHIKLLQLYWAREVGLSICNSFIANNKTDLYDYYNRGRIITKAIENNIATVHIDKFIVQRVQRVDYDTLEESFYPSFFQDEIDKEYEIRTYYLDRNCYSIRFSSNSDNIDMRDNYAVSWYEPYKLPVSIEEKVIKLMEKLQSISGSLDFVKSKDGNYYFLEVNLNGQYDWVSHYGGYNLHKKIAGFLKSKI